MTFACLSDEALSDTQARQACQARCVVGKEEGLQYN